MQDDFVRRGLVRREVSGVSGSVARLSGGGKVLSVAAMRGSRPWVWLLLVTVGLTFCFVIADGIRDFLELNIPLRNGVLVVEAWIPRTALAGVPTAVESGRYREIVVVGEARGESGDDVDAVVSELTRLGLNPNKIVRINVPPESTQQVFVVPVFLGPVSIRAATLGSSRRTYAGAIAVKKWLRTEVRSVVSIDVFTVGVHSRKSRLLMQHALGRRYRVGVIAAPSTDYDTWLWPLSKNGRCLVLRNIAGYLYFRTLVAFGWI